MNRLLSSRPQTKCFAADPVWISWEVLPVAFHSLDNPHEQPWLNQLPQGNRQKHKWFSGENGPKACLFLSLLSMYFLVFVFVSFSYSVTFFPLKFSLSNVVVSREYYWEGAIPLFFHDSSFDLELRYLSCTDYEPFFESLLSREWLSNNIM